jgi:tRNA uracil 4-sulfurtransferase
MMLRIAQRIARDVRARALVTGDVIGQVASQTLDNMTTIDRASHMSIFRPLVGMDKEEIIRTAKQLGTFDISVIPDQDSCTLFTPRHPETHAQRYMIDPVELTLPVDTMVADAVRAAVVEDLSYPMVK